MVRPLERVGFDRIHVFARQVEAAFVKHNAFNLSGEFNLTRHALKPVFETFSLRQLQPGTVVICDNHATHYNEKAAEAVRDVGCWFLYLPPYSPDLNPIEMAFSKLKAQLPGIGARTFDQMFDALAEVRDLFTRDQCWNFFREAGYDSS